MLTETKEDILLRMQDDLKKHCQNPKKKENG